MNPNTYTLFVDESGIANLNDKNSNIYILCGGFINNTKKNSYEKRIMDIFKGKLFSIDSKTGIEKAKILKKIKPFAILP